MLCLPHGREERPVFLPVGCFRKGREGCVLGGVSLICSHRVYLRTLFSRLAKWTSGLHRGAV